MFFKKKEILKPKRPELSIAHEIILHQEGYIDLSELTDEALNRIINVASSQLWVQKEKI